MDDSFPPGLGVEATNLISSVVVDSNSSSSGDGTDRISPSVSGNCFSAGDVRTALTDVVGSSEVSSQQEAPCEQKDNELGFHLESVLDSLWYENANSNNDESTLKRTMDGLSPDSKLSDSLLSAENNGEQKVKPLCPFYNTPGRTCFAGDGCSYLHLSPTGSVIPTNGTKRKDPNEKYMTSAKPGETKQCYAFSSKGGCAKGSACLFLHTPKNGDKAPHSGAFVICSYVSPVGVACTMERLAGGTHGVPNVYCKMHKNQVMEQQKAAKAAKKAASGPTKHCTHLFADGTKCTNLSCTDGKGRHCAHHRYQQGGGRAPEQTPAKISSFSEQPVRASPAVVVPSPAQSSSPSSAVQQKLPPAPPIADSLKQLVGQSVLSKLVAEQDAERRLALGKLLKLLNEDTTWVLSTIDQAANSPDININQLIDALLTMVNVMSMA